jgi:uncharacterized membrane protein
MSGLEPLGFGLLAILAMAAVTLAMRAGGFWLMGHVPLTARMRRILEALPGSIVAAIVLPIVAKTGAAALLALTAAVVTMLVRRNELLAIAAGVTVAAMARGAGI